MPMANLQPNHFLYLATVEHSTNRQFRSPGSIRGRVALLSDVAKCGGRGMEGGGGGLGNVYLLLEGICGP